MNFKKIFLGIITPVLILGLLAPVLVSAQNGNNKREMVQNRFCELVYQHTAKILEKIADSEIKLAARRRERLNRIATRQEEHNRIREENRARWDENRVQQLLQLENRFQTEQEQQAFLKFKSAVIEAIGIRRRAMDTAIQSFRERLQEAIMARQTATDESVLALKNALNAAFEKAKSDCQSDANPGTVRNNFIQALREARQKYIDEKQDIEKLSDSVLGLVEARREAFEKAHNEFKEALEKARDEFKAAVSVPTPEPSPSPSPSPALTPSPSPTVSPSPTPTP